MLITYQEHELRLRILLVFCQVLLWAKERCRSRMVEPTEGLDCIDWDCRRVWQVRVDGHVVD